MCFSKRSRERKAAAVARFAFAESRSCTTNMVRGCEKHPPSVPFTDSMLQEKATQLAAALGIVDFKASNGFINRFKLRHSIESKLILSEGASAPHKTVEEY